MVNKNFDCRFKHFLKPFSRINVRIFILIVKIVDNSTSSKILVVYVVNNLRYLSHDKLIWLELGSKISKGEMSIFKKLLLNSEDKLNILVHGIFKSLVHGFTIHTRGFTDRES